MLTERQKLVMQVIIDNYIATAEPVGSRAIARKKGIQFSAATIRNEMADLEEMGYLTQPHTSAGRIPSNLGYRFYVDHVLEPKKLPKLMVEQIQDMYAEQYAEFEQVIQQTASVLSNLTNYTAIVLGTDLFDAYLKQIQLLPLSARSAVAIIVTTTGHVENRKIFVPEGTSIYEMEKLVNLLNHQLKGVPMYRLNERLYTEIAQEMKQHMEQYREGMQILEQVLVNEKEERVFLDGATNIFSQPEFRDVEKVKGLFELLEQHDRVQDMLLPQISQGGIQVSIGQENEDEAVSDCSIITASYSIGDQPVGSLSILGPTRMDYQKVISIVDHLARDLNIILNRLYQDEN